MREEEIPRVGDGRRDTSCFADPWKTLVLLLPTCPSRKRNFKWTSSFYRTMLLFNIMANICYLSLPLILILKFDQNGGVDLLSSFFSSLARLSYLSFVTVLFRRGIFCHLPCACSCSYASSPLLSSPFFCLCPLTSAYLRSPLLFLLLTTTAITIAAIPIIATITTRTHRSIY